MKAILEHENIGPNSLETNEQRRPAQLAPGEQRRRGYNLPVDPSLYRFGAAKKDDLDNVASCFKPQNFDPLIATKLERKEVEAVRLAKHTPPFQSSTNK